MFALQGEQRAKINRVRVTESAAFEEKVQSFFTKSQVSKVLFHVEESHMEGFAKWAKSF
jgi:hypothetical protein